MTKRQTLAGAAALGAAVVGALVVLVMFVSNEDADGTAQLTVGYIPIADCAQLYVAIERGFFAEEGLEVKLVPMAGGAKILAALASGSIEVGFSNVVSLILARSAGHRFVAITGGPVEDQEHKEHAILVPKASRLETPKDLEGRSIALNTRKNIDELFVRRYLEHHGVDPQTVTFVEVPFPRMETVLQGGDVDAIATIEPFVTFALQHGRVRLLGYNYTEIEERIEISSYNVEETWLAENHFAARAFSRAISKATAYIRTHDAATREIVTKYTALDRRQVEEITLPTFADSLSLGQLRQRMDELADLGWIEKPFDPAVLLNRPPGAE